MVDMKWLSTVHTQDFTARLTVGPVTPAVVRLATAPSATVEVDTLMGLNFCQSGNNR